MSASQASRLDITREVSFGPNDGNCLPLTRCACGKTWEPWGFRLWGEAMSQQCPQCGRKMWFDCGITVWQEVAPSVVPAAAAAANATAHERPEEASILVDPRPATPLSDAMDEIVSVISGVFNARGHRKMTE